MFVQMAEAWLTNLKEEHSPSGIPLIFFMFSKMQAVLTHAI